MAEKLWQAIIVASGRNAKSELSKAYGTSHDWMISLGGVPMIARVFAAVHGAAFARQVLVSTDDPTAVSRVLARDMRFVRTVPSAGTMASSALAACQLSDSYPILIIRGDGALISPRLIRAFQLASLKSGADATAAFVSRKQLAQSFPDRRHTATKFNDGSVRFCGMLAVLSPQGVKLLETWNTLERQNKSKARLARALGFGTYVRYLFGKLSLEAAFAQLSKHAGTIAKPIMLARPEAGLEIIRKSDVALAENLLAAQRVR